MTRAKSCFSLLLSGSSPWLWRQRQTTTTERREEEEEEAAARSSFQGQMQLWSKEKMKNLRRRFPAPFKLPQTHLVADLLFLLQDPSFLLPNVPPTGEQLANAPLNVRQTFLLCLGSG